MVNVLFAYPFSSVLRHANPLVTLDDSKIFRESQVVKLQVL